MTLSSTSTAHLPRRDGRCQASAGATVKDQPEPMSWISRNSVKDQVTPERPASPGTRHFGRGPPGIRTPNLRIKSPLLCQIELEARRSLATDPRASGDRGDSNPQPPGPQPGALTT